MYNEIYNFGKGIQGAKLYVDEEHYCIEWYFPGPDRRYHGSKLSLYNDDYKYLSYSGYKLSEYIKAWKNNFLKYMELKTKSKLGGSFEVKGECNMTIRIGGYFEGVCVQGYKLPINTQEKLDTLIDGLSKVETRVNIIRQELYGIKEVDCVRYQKQKRIEEIEKQIKDLQKELNILRDEN